MRNYYLTFCLVFMASIVFAQPSLKNKESEALLKKSFITEEAIIGVDFSPSGLYLVSGGASGVVEVRNVTTGKIVHKLEGHTDDILAVKCSPGGRLVATGGVDKKVILWDIISGQKVNVLEGHRDYVRDLEFSPDGRLLVSASWDQTAIVWDAVLGTRVQTMSGHQDNVTSVSFSPDGKRIVTACGDHKLRIWEVETGELLNVLEGHTDEIWDVEWSHASNILATGAWDNKARTWDPDQARQIDVFPGHVTDVWSVSFDPNGLLLATSGGDRKIKLWDLATGKFIMNLCENTHVSDIEEVAFSPDGSMVASVSRDGSMRLWDVPRLEGRIEKMTADSLQVWIVQEEFETTAEYERRLKRKDKVRREIKEELTRAFIAHYSKNIPWEADISIGDYNADGGHFELTSRIFGSLKLLVEPSEAKKVLENKDRLEFRDLSLEFIQGRIMVSSMTAYLKGLNTRYKITM